MGNDTARRQNEKWLPIVFSSRSLTLNHAGPNQGFFIYFRPLNYFPVFSKGDRFAGFGLKGGMVMVVRFSGAKRSNTTPKAPF